MNGVLSVRDTVLDHHSDTLRVETRFKNGRLYDAIADSSMQYAESQCKRGIAGPVTSFCRIYNLNGSQRGHIYQLLNLTISPMIVVDGTPTYRPICETLASLLMKDIGWLFPPSLYAVKWPSVAVYMSHERVISLDRARHDQLALDPEQFDRVARRELVDGIAKAVDSLTPREARVIRRRFGMDDGGGATLAEVGEELSVSVERVRQIEAKAMRKLRHPVRSRPLLSWVSQLDASKAVMPQLTPPPTIDVPVPEGNAVPAPVEAPIMEAQTSPIKSFVRAVWRWQANVMPSDLKDLMRFVSAPKNAIKPEVVRILVPTQGPFDSFGRINIVVEGVALRPRY